MIDRQTIERIKDAADIVDIVSDFVSLRKVGVNYRGLCPFHDDHTPSFYVSPARRTCHCFVCGEGGDSVGFIMRYEQKTYPEALRWIADRYHIEIKEEELTAEQRKQQTDREAMFIVNEWAANYFNSTLLNDVDGRAVGLQYFRQRGIRDDIIERFRLGFSLASRDDMSTAALSAGYNGDYLVKTGLCVRRDDGKLQDRYVSRVMFPWFNVSGKVVAFGGRVLDSRTKGVMQKYINSSDSEIYHKDSELYGLYQAKKAIAKQDCVYMVEGYTDVLSMHQCGLENVVANSGTALSMHQVHLLHRFTQNIVLLYDGDEAGIKAALRGMDMLLQEGMNVKVLLLPDGDDPDSFARKHNADEFRQYIHDHQVDAIEFKVRVMYDTATDVPARAVAISEIIKTVSVISDPIIRASYIQFCTSRLSMSELLLTQRLNDEIRNNREEKRREEERKRRQQERQQQNYQSTGQQAGQPSGVGAAHGGTASQGVSSDGAPPPDAFLPDEAFSQPHGQPSMASSLQPGQPVTTPVRQGEGNGSVGASAAAGGVKVQEPLPDLIMRMVVKYGERIIFDDVELEDGGTTSLNLAQYVCMDLQSDGLQFDNILYGRMLDVSANADLRDGQTMEQFLIGQADGDITALAVRLSADRVLLTKRLEINPSVDMLREQVKHLLLDFRMDYVTKRLDALQKAIGNVHNDIDEMNSLMMQYTETQKVRNEIAKRVGANVVLK